VEIEFLLEYQQDSNRELVRFEKKLVRVGGDSASRCYDLESEIYLITPRDEELVTGIKPKEAKRWAKRLEIPQAAADQVT
jgi:hypothetical protein